MTLKKEKNFLDILEYSYKKYYNLLYNYGLKFINDPELIQDFIQDIFFRLCKKGNLDDIHVLKIYLLRAMKNTIYNYHTQQNETINIEDIEFSLSDDSESLKSFFAKDDKDIQEYQLILKGINTLSSQQKQILYLFYIKDLSHKEISAILDITPQSSMNALSKAIRKIRTLVNEES
ncbi:RNA polymerase sigma factor [Phocaeicola plebeius]|uniref:RNA polymerase sigma factor n=1 Tax=Phocaeicola plebeius TaxID=310297 RepID=UPI0026E9524B|nr:sigma-70 family RNA polymerase sigma factor [Phocaeicola plebeius]